ncbi:MAG: hypothetical protein AAGE84_14245 [Cyanobacteria bacterium P01_G01_bin.39]
MKQKPKIKFQLRTTVVLPFVLQIAAAVGIVGFLSFQTSRAAVNNLSTQLRSEVTNRIQQKLTDYLDTPILIDQINAKNLAIGALDMRKTDAVLRHFWSQIHQKRCYPTTTLTKNSFF